MRGIFDQRHMSGPDLRQTVEQVEESWREFAAKKRGEAGPVPPQFLDPAYEIHVRRGATRAYISDNRWVADCPNRLCNGGIACWPEHARGCCLGCGSIWTIEFPTAEEIQVAAEALLVRPEQHRHWKPWEQQAHELRLENIQHGYLPDQPSAAGATTAREIAEELGVDLQTVERILARDRELLQSTERFA